ncbi:hypothetical protein [Herbidospora sp. NBRC 101105]|uniref:hypothetical protein n=1 Tax=Herbidospora sp. NBRC 101105 TaxID=3032195 RepID=UPI0024A0E73E|nr:hypothetical protein [Herbidospora sp. NBRC 101105]GLX99065.1 hypothetical protein Hesp01_70150 [Herbidospora sp. NBRC 101105]
MIMTLVLAGSLAVAPLSDAEIKSALLTAKDFGKGTAVLVRDVDAGILSTFRVDHARCMEALKDYDAAFGGTRPSAWTFGKVAALHQVFTGNAATIKSLKAAASRVGPACDGQTGFRGESSFKRKKVANLADATYAFEVTFDYVPYGLGRNATYVSEFVVVAYKSAVIVYQGQSGKGRSTWTTTVKNTKKAVAKLKKVYAKRA